MAQATAPAAPTGQELAEHVTPAGTTAVQHPPVSPGKVAMWLFLATEVMFFTGLIGSYIVLRTGSPPSAYSNFFPPGTDLSRLADTRGVRLISPGSNPERVAEIISKATGVSRHEAEHLVESAPTDVVLGVSPSKAATAHDQLVA